MVGSEEKPSYVLRPENVDFAVDAMEGHRFVLVAARPAREGDEEDGRGGDGEHEDAGEGDAEGNVHDDALDVEDEEEGEEELEDGQNGEDGEVAELEGRPVASFLQGVVVQLVGAINEADPRKGE